MGAPGLSGPQWSNTPAGSKNKKIPFIKMQGTGNDFVLLDAVSNDLGGLDLPAVSRKLLDRRFGIGADQLLVLLPSSGPAPQGKSRLRMRIFNVDGSEVQMCGNGIRCLAKYAWSRGLASRSKSLEVETLAGIIIPEAKDGLVRVDMGLPRLEGREIPALADGRIIDYPLKIEETLFAVTCVSMGNPHTVIFVGDVAAFPVGFYGPKIENHPFFPERTNVEFIQVVSRQELKMRVWERGSGETLACGTGASASAVASALKGLTSGRVSVELAGGRLEIEWDKNENGHVYMTGPAEEVFEGEIFI